LDLPIGLLEAGKVYSNVGNKIDTLSYGIKKNPLK